MKSLMQQFAEAKQQRLVLQKQRQQDTSALLAQANADRQDLAQQIKVEAIANRQGRTDAEQIRRVTASQDQAQRVQELQKRAVEIENLLATSQRDRLSNAAIDAQARGQAVQNRQAEVQAQLAQFHTNQQQLAQTLQLQFQQLRDRLQEMSKARHVQADQAAQARLQELETRVAAVKAELSTIHQTRITTSESDRQERILDRQAGVAAVAALMQQIRAEYQDLQIYVWGEVPTQPQSTSELAKVEVKIEVQDLAAQVSDRPNPEVEIQKFILSYVSQLDNPVPLAQLVSDRDAVKTLLSQGAATLNVDPSEILNQLLKMVEA